ncbi:hypothetical protein [Citrobacter murliniae]|uniref:hypothetical protein n=1 Tax=Citrobacter TaxID=544 RepID=UPI0010A48273|nr:hypothetical protein [Citrobacter murliniae]
MYLENSSNFSLKTNTIVNSSNSGMYSLRLFGSISNGVISGNYTGTGYIGTDATYVNVVADGAYFVSPSIVNIGFPFKNSTIDVSTGTAANIAALMDNCRVFAHAGHGGSIATSNIMLNECDIMGTDSGIYCSDGVNRIRANGTKFTGGTGSGLRINTGSKHILQGCTFKSTSGNSVLLTGSSGVIYIGNDDSSNPANFTGTTFTLNN